MKAKVFAAIAGLVMAGSAFAAGNQLLVTGAANKGSSAIGLDLVSDGQGVAFNFAISLPGVSEKGVDLSSCTSGLPKGWTAFCAFKNGQVRVAAMGGLDMPLPKGVVTVGQVKVKGLSGSPEVQELEISDRNANAVEVTSASSVE